MIACDAAQDGRDPTFLSALETQAAPWLVRDALRAIQILPSLIAAERADLCVAAERDAALSFAAQVDGAKCERVISHRGGPSTGFGVRSLVRSGVCNAGAGGGCCGW